MEGINLIHGDSLEAMKGYADNHFDVAIVDPPYGLGKRTTDGGSKKNTQTKFMKDIRRTNWDDAVPTKEYFNELKRVSKNQIIWGGNYFELHSYRTFITWDKMTYVPTMSQVELAYTSFDSPARLIKINSNQIDRMHPTQKPVKLYKWLLENYTNEGDLILDTHLGSGSIAIACHYMKRNLIGYEIDKEYYDAACKRFKEQTSQKALW
jgi:site-specific DNA-methyltransferase (adenine-specific)